jgi:hypothetical protein
MLGIVSSENSQEFGKPTIGLVRLVTKTDSIIFRERMMRRWMSGLALASGWTIAFGYGASAQVAKTPEAPVPVQIVPAQVQVQVVPGGQIQIAPGQIQIQAQQIQIAQAGFTAPIRAFNLQPDAVVIGRVIALEPMDVEAPPAAGQQNVNYRIAVVQVSEALHGVKKDTTMIRVGFPAQPMNNVGGGVIQVQPGGGPPPRRIIRPGFGGISLEVGQDGLFTMTKHHKENFYLLPNYHSFVTSQNNANFANEVKNAKQLPKVLEDTAAALKSTEQAQRFLAAAVLISKYRSNTTGQPTKQEPIDAVESKLILKALAEGNWIPGQFIGAVPGAMELFHMLGITQADGYQPANFRGNQQDFADAMQKWVNDNTDKYRIKKLVADPNAKAQADGNQPGVAQPGVIQPGVVGQPLILPPAPVQPAQPQDK